MMAFAGRAWTTQFRDPKTIALADILHERRGAPPARLLVVGCGKGTEAAVLRQRLGAETTGVDIVPEFDTDAASMVTLQQGDATRLEFGDESFDFVFSFHALEHIPDYRTALREMRRVLNPRGGYLIGTPNRSRLIGYLGSRQATLPEKIRWNVNDWKGKLRGEFRNELGAHAGYTTKELRFELSRVFSRVEDITPDYYLRVYARKRMMVSALYNIGMWRFLFPAIYFYGTR
jgi:SAM-dependent methyltransferase